MLFAKIEPKFRGVALKHFNYVFKALIEINSYVVSNMDNYPPEDANRSIQHNEETLTRVENARVAVDYLVDVSKCGNGELWGARVKRLIAVFDDFYSHLDNLKSMGVWHK